jgi:histidine triad (HIT) family protein
MTRSRNIELPVNHSCAFCAYLKGERPYTIFFRDKLAAILVTREQRGVSHLLVMPTRHCETILDLTEAESAVMMREIRHAAHVIDVADGRPGIAIWQNNGVPANQTIGHLHFHVAGTLEVGGTDWGEVPELSVAETDAIADKLHRAEGSLRWIDGLPSLTRRRSPFDLIQLD